MKERKFYSEAFKKAVIQEVLSGRLSKEQAKIKYKIAGNSAILNWIRNFDASKSDQMKKTKSSKLEEVKQQELEVENKRLREELDLERLRTLSLNVMIDIAEEHFKVPIRKKSGAKQLKK
jgi:transposase